jgi:hypothetical protein
MDSIKKLSVYYAPNEYTGEIGNADLARQYATKDEYRPHWPLLVETVEHGGWAMTHYFDTDHPNGIAVGTANDAAGWSDEQRSLRDKLYNASRDPLPDVRRTTEDAIEDTAQTLFALGLHDVPHGVLTAGGARELALGTSPAYSGLDLTKIGVKDALRRFYMVCLRINDLDRCI